MIPTVAQQVGAVRNTIAKTVLPALDPSESFAAEQAGLVLACLDWILDVHASEHRYECAEHAENRALLAMLVEFVPAGSGGEARELIAESAEPPEDLVRLRAQVRRMKSLVERTYGSLAASGSAGETASRAVAEVARRQSERELAWCRMTGFPQGVAQSIAEVLEAQQPVQF
ncbi:hypothetical protein CJ179_15455 [Rhodococcus sp. ACS1]|uniref:hypothetical protein n=1 Tax=Rhodococcus TaxID=1827 RepID=UPI000BB0DA98|nr:hypothetical protein [Rhodococcus sp. ACS1]PBC48247.1 hypothetical protein CJ179_15455 [Rhodococcus sp. ACS1]